MKLLLLKVWLKIKSLFKRHPIADEAAKVLELVVKKVEDKKDKI